MGSYSLKVMYSKYEKADFHLFEEIWICCSKLYIVSYGIKRKLFRRVKTAENGTFFTIHVPKLGPRLDFFGNFGLKLGPDSLSATQKMVPYKKFIDLATMS